MGCKDDARVSFAIITVHAIGHMRPMADWVSVKWWRIIQSTSMAHIRQREQRINWYQNERLLHCRWCPKMHIAQLQLDVSFAAIYIIWVASIWNDCGVSTYYGFTWQANVKKKVKTEYCLFAGVVTISVTDTLPYDNMACIKRPFKIWYSILLLAALSMLVLYRVFRVIPLPIN